MGVAAYQIMVLVEIAGIWSTGGAIAALACLLTFLALKPFV